MRIAPRLGALLAFGLALASAAGTSRSGSAGEPQTEAVRTEVWDGYVWKDQQGRLQLGRGVVAMGVMAMPDQVIAEPLAAKLARYAVATSEYVFWNYLLERPEREALDGVPRVLVRLEGRVDVGEDPSPGMFPRMAPRTLREARLTSIEFLPDEWLKDWAFFFRTPASPFRVAATPQLTPAEERAFAVQALEVLRHMRARPGASEAQRAEARALDAEARVSERFRRGEEHDVQRWLVGAAKEKGWQIEGLSDLPPLPPHTTEIQGWFLAAQNKAAFLAKVRAAWKGDLDALQLVHYVSDGQSTSYATVDLLEVEQRWSEADVKRAQEVTSAMGALR